MLWINISFNILFKHFLTFIIPFKKTLFENIIGNYQTNEEIILIDNSSMDFEIQVIKTLLRLLNTYNKRSKVGIKELRTVWKWISGTPDHDDFMKITNKMNY